MLFRYEAISSSGATVTGDLEADSEIAAVKKLNAQQLTAIHIDEASQSAHSDRKAKSSNQEKLLALHELATLLESGIGIADTIESQALADYPTDLHEAFTAIAKNLNQGDSFTQAVQKTSLDLPDYVHQLIEAGELTGNLGGSLRLAVDQMEYSQKLTAEFKAALIYPSILVLSGILAVMLVFVFVVPKFASLVERNSDLPFLAEFVLKGGIWFNDHIWWVFAIGVSVTAGVFSAARQPGFQQKALDLVSQMPLFGDWITESDTAKWSAVMAALLSSKVDLLSALKLARQGVNTTIRLEKHLRVISAVRGGESLAEALETAQVLTPTGYNLVRVGEKTGRLPEMMRSLARLYDESSRNRMQTVLALIEPLAILLIGAVIGTIILGVILAITSVNEVSF